MHALCEMQHDDLKRATFLGMTTEVANVRRHLGIIRQFGLPADHGMVLVPEEAKVIGERRRRITALVDRIARLRATQ